MEGYVYYQRSLIWGKEPSAEKRLSKTEARRLLKGSGALLLRNLYDFDCPEETQFWHVLKESFGGMDELTSKTRNMVRKAISLLDVRIIDKSVLMEQGYEVYISAYESYQKKSDTPVSLEKFISALKKDQSEGHYWGCFEKESGKLIAYAHTVIRDTVCIYSSLKAIPGYLKLHYPFYGLIFTMNEYYLDTLKLKYVSDGARSITNHSNIQSFLVDRFKFRKAWCRISVYYVWWLHLLVKMLFPFRGMISNVKIKAILTQEAWARGY
jgi:hypothetical protein